MKLPQESPAAVLSAPRTIEVTQVAAGELPAAGAWLEVEACGVCGSDWTHESSLGTGVDGLYSVNFSIDGGHVALDKSMLEQMSDPVVASAAHLFKPRDQYRLASGGGFGGFGGGGRGGPVTPENAPVHPTGQRIRHRP